MLTKTTATFASAAIIIAGVPALAEAAPLPARTFTLTGKVTSVVDGDTIKVKVGRKILTVNLRGAVTASGCKTKAVSQLRTFNGKTVSLRAGSRSGTVNATVKSGSTDLSVTLVSKGLANVGRTTGLSSAAKRSLNSAASSAKKNKRGRFAAGGCAASTSTGNAGLRLPAGWTVEGSIDSIASAFVGSQVVPTRQAFVDFINAGISQIASKVGPGRQMVGQVGDASGLGGSIFEAIGLCSGSRFVRQIETVNNPNVDLMDDSPSTQVTGPSGGSVASVARGRFAIKLQLTRTQAPTAVMTLTPDGGSPRVSAIDLLGNGRIVGFNFRESGYATAPFDGSCS